MTAPETFTIHQTIQAPPDRVFRAWTDPAQVSRWFVPVEGWSAPLSKVSIDARVGGTWRVTMVDDTGAEFPAVFVYREVSEPDRLVFTTGAPGQDPNDPAMPLATVTFVDLGGSTQMIYAGVTTDPDHSEVEGWKAMLARLADQVAST